MQEDINDKRPNSTGSECQTNSFFEHFTVSPFDKNNLFQEVAKHTGCSIHEVQGKVQMHHLVDLLEKIAKTSFPEALNRITMIIEHEYVHRPTLHDYQHFNVFSFHKFNRYCARICFFHGFYARESVRVAINGMDKSSMSRISTLKERFIGSIVLRKDQLAFLAQVILPSPFSQGEFQGISLPFLREYGMGFFGIPLIARKCISWGEQDRVTSACAASAILALYNALKMDLNNPDFPSPARITLQASAGNAALLPGFPNKGLTPPMMAQALLAQGLTPFQVNLSCRSGDDVEEVTYRRMFRFIHAYTCNGATAPILGLSFFKKIVKSSGSEPSDTADLKALYDQPDGHAVTVIGYSNWQQRVEALWQDEEFIDCFNKAPKYGHHSWADKIPFLIVHDDQTSPYSKCERKNDENGFYINASTQQTLQENVVEKGPVLLKQYLEHTWDHFSDKKQIQKQSSVDYRRLPEFLLMGLHPKVRLHLKEVESVVENFETSLSSMVFMLAKSNKEKAKEAFLVLCPDREFDVESERQVWYQWDIHLVKNTELKSALRQQFYDGKIPVDEASKTILEKGWPLYLWRAEAWDKNGRVLDIILDATDPRTSNAILHLVLYREMEEVSKVVVLTVGDPEDRLERSSWMDSIVLLHWAKQRRGDFNYLDDRKKDELEKLYGKPHLPLSLSQIEQSDDGLCRLIDEFYKLALDTNKPMKRKIIDCYDINNIKGSLPPLDAENSPYIWLMGNEGNLIIGREYAPDPTKPGEKLGHPSLVGGRRARIAGELNWNNEKNKWLVNNRSGRYTKGSEKTTKEHLSNIANIFIKLNNNNGIVFDLDYCKEYNSYPINGLFDLKKKIGEYVGIDLDSRSCGVEVARMLADSPPMIDEISEILRFLSGKNEEIQFNAEQLPKARQVGVYALALWLGQVDANKLNLNNDDIGILTNWLDSSDPELKQAALEVIIVIYGKLGLLQYLVTKALQKIASDQYAIPDDKDITLSRIRQFLHSMEK